MSLYQTMAIEMAHYNRWQNESLYAQCAQMGDATRNQEAELFFGGIHRTLDHIVRVDHVFLKYLEDQKPPENLDPSTRMHNEFGGLRADRVRLDQTIRATGSKRNFFYSERLNRNRAFPRPLMVRVIAVRLMYCSLNYFDADLLSWQR